MEQVITVQHLRRTYGSVVAVDDVSFEVQRNEIFGLLGPNGAGKTTTIECLQALRSPDSGRIRVLGLDPVTEARELRARIGSQLQESALPGSPRRAVGRCQKCLVVSCQDSSRLGSWVHTGPTAATVAAWGARPLAATARRTTLRGSARPSLDDG